MHHPLSGPRTLVEAVRTDTQLLNNANLLKGGPLLWYRRVVA